MRHDRHARWALVIELLFFLVSLATAAAVAHSTALGPGSPLARALHQMDRTFVPLAGLHPWWRLGLGIFSHNVRPYIAFALVFWLVHALARRGRRRLAGILLTLEALAAAAFWFANVAAAGVVVGAVAQARHVAPLRVWATLLPHGVFEIFAFSWVMALPLHMAWRWLDGNGPAQAASDLARPLWPGTLKVLLVLALAAAIESGISPRVLHALVPSAGRSLPASTRSPA